MLVRLKIELYISFALRLLDNKLSVSPYLFISNCLCGKFGIFLSICVQKMASIYSFLSLSSDMLY